MTARITAHAIERYRQRVDPSASEADVIARLDTPRIREMIAFGAREIILPTGHHAVVSDGYIVTVRPRHGRRTRILDRHPQAAAADMAETLLRIDQRWGNGGT